LRISFTLRGKTLEDDAGGWLSTVRALAKALPLCQLILGASDRGVWRVTEAGYTETEWTSSGTPAIAEVILNLRQASDAAIPVGPIPTTPKKTK
jgi:hypothetical protein